MTSSGESPTTTAAAPTPGREASSWLRSRWPANSLRASSEVEDVERPSGNVAAVQAADIDRADRNRSGGIGAPIRALPLEARAAEERLFVTIR